jgi:nucleoside 2-deoxyribosyltransferase/N-acetylglutamate synthase-like GNAT family acetyltransferase
MTAPAAPQIYLAGPDVFRTDAQRVFARLQRRCAQLGLRGIAPVDDAPATPTLDGDRLAQSIYQGNIERIAAADGVLAHVCDFRGLEPDAGTVFEIGYAVALGKPVVLYGVPPGSYAERVAATRPCAADAHGVLRERANGLMVEGLDQRLNLMLTCSSLQADSADAGLQRLAERLQAQPALVLRRYQASDAMALYRVFHAAVHQGTGAHYNAAQRAAWAPPAPDHPKWAARLQRNQPWVALWHGELAGFADLQPDGLVDQMFVAPQCAGRGVGDALMARLIEQAQAHGIETLHADVSLAAEGFFLRHGFVVQQRQWVERRGAVLANARMQRRLPPSAHAAAYNRAG